jgi:hypothetical protein
LKQFSKCALLEANERQKLIQLFYFFYSGLSFWHLIELHFRFSALTTEKLADFRAQFSSDEKTIFAQNVVSRSDPLETCLSRKALEAARHIYSHKVPYFLKKDPQSYK